MVQAMLNGWGGLRLQDAGLGLLAPALPEGVGALTLRKIAWRGLALTLVISAEQQTLELVGGPPGAAALVTDALGARYSLTLGGPAAVLPRSAFAYPGLLTLS
jgi:trehalose/maltose hydrolase-like predicted phosphorylase